MFSIENNGEFLRDCLVFIKLAHFSVRIGLHSKNMPLTANKDEESNPKLGCANKLGFEYTHFKRYDAYTSSFLIISATSLKV